MNGELLRSVNCSRLPLNRITGQLLPEHLERLVLAQNGLEDLLVDRSFGCESLIELHVTQQALHSLYSRPAAVAPAPASSRAQSVHGDWSREAPHLNSAAGGGADKHGGWSRSKVDPRQRLPLLLACHRLRSLDLSGNSLGTLGAGSFKRQKRLEQLRLERSRLHSIERHAFAGLSQLRYLSLKRNQLAEINSEMFQNLNALRVSLLLIYLKIFGPRFKII